LPTAFSAVAISYAADKQMANWRIVKERLCHLARGMDLKHSIGVGVSLLTINGAD
jgi:hypothetical protein